MRVLVVEPKKAPYVKEVGEELPDLQKEVGGFIEAVYPFEDDAAIICNEEGKQKNLELNRALFDRDGEVYDIIAGTFLITGTREDSFGSLSPEQIDRYSRRYETPETFLFEGNRIRVKKELPRAERNEQRFFKNGFTLSVREDPDPVSPRRSFDNFGTVVSFDRETVTVDQSLDLFSFGFIGDETEFALFLTQQDVLVNRKRRDQGKFLEDNGDTCVGSVVTVIDFDLLTVHKDLSAILCVDTGQDLDQSGFTGTIFS